MFPKYFLFSLYHMGLRSFFIRLQPNITLKKNITNIKSLVQEFERIENFDSAFELCENGVVRYNDKIWLMASCDGSSLFDAFGDYTTLLLEDNGNVKVQNGKLVGGEYWLVKDE